MSASPRFTRHFNLSGSLIFTPVLQPRTIKRVSTAWHVFRCVCTVVNNSTPVTAFSTPLCKQRYRPYCPATAITNVHTSTAFNGQHTDPPDSVRYKAAIKWIIECITQAEALYSLHGITAAFLHGVELPAVPEAVRVRIQWDFLQPLHCQLQPHHPSPITKGPCGMQEFVVQHKGASL